MLPQAPLRLRTGPEVEHIAKSDLAQCNLAVFPVGAYYGPVPERSGDRSITELQLDAALGDGRNGTLSRMVWVPPGITMPSTSSGSNASLVRIRTELPSQGFEIIESPLTEIETHINDRLERPAPAAQAADVTAEDSAEIYLLCLPTDREAARAVRDYLFNEGFEVKLPGTTDEGAGRCTRGGWNRRTRS